MKFTCDDDPHHGNDSLKKQAIKKANDLAETKISLELLPVGKADFDARKFYVDLVPEVDDVSSSAQRFEDLLSVVKKRVHKKRALARIRFLSALSCTLHWGHSNKVALVLPFQPSWVRISVLSKNFERF